MLRTVGETVAAGIVLILVLVIIDRSSRRFPHSLEGPRKTAHIVGGMIVAALPLILPLYAVAILGVVFLPIFLLSRRFSLLPSIHAAERTTIGELYFPAGIACACVLTPNIAAVIDGILVMVLADGFAAIVGKRAGRHPLRVPFGKKTIEGSAAFFAIALCIAVAVAFVRHISPDRTLALAGTAVIMTGVEAATAGGLDNLLLPPVGALLAAWALG